MAETTENMKKLYHSLIEQAESLEAEAKEMRIRASELKEAIDVLHEKFGTTNEE